MCSDLSMKFLAFTMLLQKAFLPLVFKVYVIAPGEADASFLTQEEEM